MALLPFFFAARPRGETIHEIDGTPIIRHLRNITISTELTHSEDAPCEPTWVWMEGSVSRLHQTIVSSHITSLAEADGRAAPGSATSWSSMCIASGLYSHSVLGLSDQSGPIDGRLLRRFLYLLVCDLDKDTQGMRTTVPPDLWYWKAFIGAYSITKHQMKAPGELPEGIEVVFDGFICRWSRATGIFIWEEAQRRLAHITWPLSGPQDVGAKLWMRATQQ